MGDPFGSGDRLSDNRASTDLECDLSLRREGGFGGVGTLERGRGEELLLGGRACLVEGPLERDLSPFPTGMAMVAGASSCSPSDSAC